MHQAKCVEQRLSVKTVSWAHKYTMCVNDSDLLGILSLSHECEDIKELARRRRFGDEHTWSIELGIRGLDEGNIMDTSLESSTFRLRVMDNSPTVEPAHYVLDYDDFLFWHPLLKHRYMVLEKDEKTSYYTVRCEALCCRLNELALVELSRILPENRPAL